MTGTAASTRAVQLQTITGGKPVSPFVSSRQRAFFNVNRKKLEKQGVDVDEWNKASKGLKLPLRSRAGQRIFRKGK